MARAAKSASEWIALISAKLLHLRDEENFTIGELADILGMTGANLGQQYIQRDPDFPIVEQGSEGSGYVINGVAALNHLLARFKKQQVDIDDKRARVALLAGIEPELVRDGGLTLAELREVSRMQDQLRRGSLEDQQRVSVVDHERVVADLCIFASEAFQSVAPELDAAGRWAPELRAEVGEYCDKKLVTLHEKFNRYLSADAFSTHDAGNGVDEPPVRRSPPRRTSKRPLTNQSTSPA